MKKYQSYKPSGVEWIGDIPELWILKKLKYFVKICNGSDFKEFVVEEGGYPVYGTGGEFSRCSRFLYDKTSVLLGRKGSVDKPQIVHEPFWTSDTTYYTEIMENVSPKYLFHLVNQIQFDRYIYGSTIPSMTKSVYDNMVFPYPRYSEQIQIVNYLDEKTEIIDKLIFTKERKIELLKEQRTSLINQVITKGLDPDVKMKDSGIEWIGEIPEHWESIGFTKIIRIRHGFQFREYDFTDDGIKVIKITQLDRDGFLNIDNCSFISQDRIEEFRDIIICENDVLMCLTGGTIGKIIKVGKVDEPLVQNYRVGHFSPNNTSILNDYIFWFMSSDVLISQIFYEIRETGQPNIGIEDFRRMKIILPPIHEQIRVIEFLDTHTKEFDEMVLLEQKKIDLLKEYRQSLISEVITGKIDVRTQVN